MPYMDKNTPPPPVAGMEWYYDDASHQWRVKGGQTGTPYQPGTQLPGSQPNSPNPSQRPTMPSNGSSSYSMPNTPSTGNGGGKGSWIWDAAKGVWSFLKDNAGDVLQTGAGVIDAYMSSEDRAKALAQSQKQFDDSMKQRQSEFDRDFGERQRSTSDAEAQAAVRAESQLNRAPMADNAQALLRARMGVAPGQFQGRDYTKGTQDLTRTFTAPSANVTSAMQAAAHNYKAGDGGVDTSMIRALLEKMKAGGGLASPTTPVTPAPRQDRPAGTLPRKQLASATNAIPESMPEPEMPSEEDDRNPNAVLKRRMGVI